MVQGGWLAFHRHGVSGNRAVPGSHPHRSLALALMRVQVAPVGLPAVGAVVAAGGGGFAGSAFCQCAGGGCGAAGADLGGSKS